MISHPVNLYFLDLRININVLTMNLFKIASCVVLTFYDSGCFPAVISLYAVLKVPFRKGKVCVHINVPGMGLFSGI